MMKYATALMMLAGPALAHADGSAHLHGTDGALWLALAVAGGAVTAFLAEDMGHEVVECGDADAAQSRLEPMAEQLNQAAIGQLSEIFDGDAPHLARGAPAQAWSVACTLEAWWRLELAKHTPPAEKDDDERRT